MKVHHRFLVVIGRNMEVVPLHAYILPAKVGLDHPPHCSVLGVNVVFWWCCTPRMTISPTLSPKNHNDRASGAFESARVGFKLEDNRKHRVCKHIIHRIGVPLQ